MHKYSVTNENVIYTGPKSASYLPLISKSQPRGKKKKKLWAEKAWEFYCTKDTATLWIVLNIKNKINKACKYS